jgi:formate dehydrogenase accessory protein FdhD
VAARRRSDTLLVTSVDREGSRRHPDELIVEEPMSIQVDGNLVATTMRTPGHDYELAVGFCHADGLLGGAPITGVRYCASGGAAETEFNVVTVETGGRAPTPTPRLGNTTSSCGLCGNDAIDQLCDVLMPLPDTVPIPLSVLAAMPARVLGAQSLFSSTGAVHAAAAFTADGTVVELEVGVDDFGQFIIVDGLLDPGPHALSIVAPGSDVPDRIVTFIVSDEVDDEGRAAVVEAREAGEERGRDDAVGGGRGLPADDEQQALGRRQGFGQGIGPGPGGKSMGRHRGSSWREVYRNCDLLANTPA